MANKNTGMSGGAKAGLGLAALAAAAGAYYFYGSKDAAKNRKNLKAWSVKAKGEVMERVEKLKDVSQETYDKAVMQVMDKYRKMKNIDPKELAALTSELRGTWKKLAAHVSGKHTSKSRTKKSATAKAK